ncbi:UNVERIFIED_CONTAM: hypothetical protein Slati_3425900 [Sesamum latifolium]|uniref:Uncharacterized protein n=1 Tax=Sesamum latifolium TaxID=2727402 RepID=A0AAW2UGE9_9LAMI
MESSNTEPKTTTVAVKFENETSTTTVDDIEKIALHPTDEKLSPSSSNKNSSSPDSTLHDPFHHDNDDDDKPTSSTTSSPAHKSEPSDHETLCVAPSTSNGTTTEAPPSQEMERSAAPYRIPSSVFTRKDSSKPMEWSVASNDSLFSIHTGNMSFTNDQYCLRSGELGREVSTSDQMFSYSADQSTDVVRADMRSRELGIAQATMKEVIQESEGQSYGARGSHRSQESNTSTKSYAFSAMTGDKENCASTRAPSSIGSCQEMGQSQTPPVTKLESQPSTNPNPETPTAATPTATTTTTTTTTTPEAKSNLFPCFSCC